MTSSRRCLLCGGDGHLWTARGDRELVRCGDCRFAWVPQGLARTETGASIYEGDTPFFLTSEHADYYLDEGAVDAARARLAWVLRLVPEGRSLLDAGANVGHFVCAAQARYDATGIEPSPAVVAWGREHLGAHLEVGAIGAGDEALLGRFDAVTLFDVIEHLPDPRAALERCRAYLRPSGHLFVTTPDAGSFAARVMGARWHYVDLVQHVSLLSTAHLRTLLGECGFEVIDRRTFGRRYRCSYITRRLDELAPGNPLLTVAALPARLLRLVPNAHVAINLRDVMGIAARRKD